MRAKSRHAMFTNIEFYEMHRVTFMDDGRITIPPFAGGALFGVWSCKHLALKPVYNSPLLKLIVIVHNDLMYTTICIYTILIITKPFQVSSITNLSQQVYTKLMRIIRNYTCTA